MKELTGNGRSCFVTNVKASFQVKMSLAYGLIEEHFDRQIEFYFAKVK